MEQLQTLLLKCNNCNH